MPGKTLRDRTAIIIFYVIVFVAGSICWGMTGYLTPVNVWDRVIHRRLFAGGKTLACPEPVDKIFAQWAFNGSKEFWPMTFVDPNAKNIRIEDGILKFTAGTKIVRFGWGNYQWGENKNYTVLSMPGQFLTNSWVEFRIKQANPVKTSLIMDFRYRGDPLNAGTWSEIYTAASGRPGPQVVVPVARGKTVDTSEWQTVRASFSSVVEADGCGLEIETVPGNEIVIDWMKIRQTNANIYARKIVTIPPGPVFSAKASVSTSLTVYMNGRVVRQGYHTPGTSRYDIVGIDLKPFLKPGKNVLAVRELSGFVSTPVCWMAGAVQMVSGQTIKFGTGPDWKVFNREFDGWLDEKFDDSMWLAPGEKDPTGYLGKDMLPYTGYNPGRFPVYCGQIELENPDAPKFFYHNEQPVRFVARIPAGLAGTVTGLKYAIWDEIKKTRVFEKTVGDGKKKGNALAYEIILDRTLDRGVYTIVLDGAGGKDPELRRQEVFVVLGKIPMPETDGKTWDDGINLTLVDEINCTDPNTPHPFADASIYDSRYPSAVVTKNGLTYRETPIHPHNQISWMSWTVSFKNLNKPHYVEIEYPDDDVRLMEVQVHPLSWRTPGRYTGDYSQETAWMSAGIQTGGKYPNTGKFQYLRFIVWSHDLQGNIMLARGNGWGGLRSCPKSGAGAAVSRIRVYEIDRLPALATNPHTQARRFGLMTERASVMERTFNNDMLAGSGLSAEPNPYVRWFTSAERYAQYCRFTGQNAYFTGSYQYTYQNSPAVTLDTGVEGSSLVPDQRDMYINVLGANGIVTYSALEYRTDVRDWHKGWVSLNQAYNGRDFMFQVDKNGSYQGGNYQRDNPFASRSAYESFRKNLSHIVNRYSIYPSWKGLALIVAPVWEGPGYDSLDVSYDDQTIRLFEKETGIKIPVDDTTTLRFGKRYEWLMANAKEQWIDWRSKKVSELHASMSQMCREKREDLEYFVLFEIPGTKYSDALEKKPSLHEHLREFGYDPKAFAGKKEVSFGRDITAYSTGSGGAGIASWDYLKDSEMVRLMNETGSNYRMALVRTGFDEWGIYSLLRDTKPKWYGGYWLGHLFPAHRYLAERFTTMLIDNDIDMFQYGFADCLKPAGGEQEMRQFVRSFVSIPRIRFTTKTGNGLDMNIVIKESRLDGETYFLVINPGWWDVTTTITLNGRGPVINLVDGTKTETPNNILTVRLGSYGVAVFKRKGRMTILKAETIVSQEARDILQARLKDYGTTLKDTEHIQRLQEYARKESENLLKKAQDAFEQGDMAGCWNNLSQWTLYRSVKLGK